MTRIGIGFMGQASAHIPPPMLVS